MSSWHGSIAGFAAAALVAAVAIGVPTAWIAAPAFAQEVAVPLPAPNPARIEAETAAPLIGPVLPDGAPVNAGGDLPLPGGDPALPLNFLPPAGLPGGANPAGAPLDLVPNPGAPLDLLPFPGGAVAGAPVPGAQAEPAQEFLLTAVLTEGGAPIPDGMVWRVFGERPGADGLLPLVTEVRGGVSRIRLVPGNYYLHAEFGRAGATTRIEVSPTSRQETVVLNAGGLRLRALIGDDVPIPPADLRFEVLSTNPDLGDRTVITQDAGPDEIVRLTAGPYQVISYYGETNAIVRADITVTAGQLTDVTLYHQAARVTLKLVTARGGEALANTAWSVVTQGGEIVFDSVGAFPTLVLAAGDYTAIAKHGDDVFQSPFTVASGLNRDVEVLAENPVQAAVVVAP